MTTPFDLIDLRYLPSFYFARSVTALTHLSRWVSCRPRFFLPVPVFSKLFRRLMLQKLLAAQKARQLRGGIELGVPEPHRI